MESVYEIYFKVGNPCRVNAVSHKVINIGEDNTQSKVYAFYDAQDNLVGQHDYDSVNGFTVRPTSDEEYMMPRSERPKSEMQRMLEKF